MSRETSSSTSWRQRLRSLFRRAHRGTEQIDETPVSLPTTAPDSDRVQSGIFTEHWTIAARGDSGLSLDCELECTLPRSEISLKELDSIVRRGAVIQQHIRTKSVSYVTESAKGLNGTGETAITRRELHDAIRLKIDEEAERWRHRRDQLASAFGQIVFEMSDTAVVHWDIEVVRRDDRDEVVGGGSLTITAGEGAEGSAVPESQGA